MSRIPAPCRIGKAQIRSVPDRPDRSCWALRQRWRPATVLRVSPRHLQPRVAPPAQPRVALPLSQAILAQRDASVPRRKPSGPRHDRPHRCGREPSACACSAPRPDASPGNGDAGRLPARWQRKPPMSNALAIAGVSAVLKDLLDSGLIDHQVTDALGAGVTVSSLAPDACRSMATTRCRGSTSFSTR